MDQIKLDGGEVKDVVAKVYTEIADQKLEGFVRNQVQTKLGVISKVETGSLHAGMKCCEHNPSLHYREPGREFHEATPTFEENIVIPWEGTRLLRQ